MVETFCALNNARQQAESGACMAPRSQSLYRLPQMQQEQAAYICQFTADVCPVSYTRSRTCEELPNIERKFALINHMHVYIHIQ
jgi:hypothetical protein